MYVRFGAPPTTTTYDCRPYLNGNNETCSFATPQTGTYYVMLRGYTAYSGVTLVGSYSTACTPPAAPTGVSASASSQTAINVSWGAASGATSYKILRSAISGGPYTQVGTSTTTSFADTGLTCSTTYYYVVRSSNGSCDSGNADAQGVVFTGAMDYWPNVDAVSWFAEHVFPAVREAVPAAQFTIVGSRPVEAVRALARQPGVVVTGGVPDVRPWLAHAACAVAPLRIARGVQNKVLEAMAMARPVIATPQAAEGIRAEAGHDFVLAQDEAYFVRAVVNQLQTASPAAQARDCILANYDWARNLGVVDRLFEPAPAVAPVLETCPA